MSRSGKARPVGRPPLPEAERRRQIGVRVSAALKASLEQSAAENGRSVAQECEMRLSQSFEREAMRKMLREEFTAIMENARVARRECWEA